jgi:hypothetical protein
MAQNRNISGLTLLEIMVSMIILVLVVLGFVNVFSVSRGYIMHSRSRLSASQLASVFLDPLQDNVTDTDWNLGTNNLRLRPIPSPIFPPATLNGVIYNANYTIADDTTTGTELRKVQVNITWNENR